MIISLLVTGLWKKLTISSLFFSYKTNLLPLLVTNQTLNKTNDRWLTIVTYGNENNELTN